jgi:putative transposase
LVADPPDGCVVLYQDETDLHWNPRIQPTYQPVGQQVRIPAAGQNRKAYAFGTVDAHSEEVVVSTYPRKRSKEFVAFLHELREAYPDVFLFLIIDNYAIHKTKEVEEFLAEDQRMALVFLPTYSPNLNEMEGVWRVFHARVTKNRLYPSQEDQLEATERYFAPMAPQPSGEEVLTRETIQDLVGIT